MLLKKFKNRFIWPILLIILTIPAFFFFLKPGMYWNMHDDMQMIRQLEMEKCFKDGQIPCRWTPDLGFGYGYPLFNYYPPLPNIVGQVFRTLGLSYMATVRWTAITQFILAALFMFILAKSLFGNFGGFIASLFYTYAPYHALNIYVRGAMNEAWASVFFPLIFYFSRQIILKNKVIDIFFLGISFCLLLLSHNPMVLTFTPILFVWVLFWIWQTYKFKIKLIIPIVIKLFFSGLLSASLAAFFTIPVLAETKLVQIGTMFTGYYSFSAHFASLKQMFLSNFWGDGGSIWGPNDGMSFMIGYIFWILAILIVLYFFFSSLKNKKIDQKLLLSFLLIAIGFGTAFLSHERSTFIWNLIIPIQKVQFPWRFLNHTTFLFSLSIGVIPYILKNHFSSKNIIFINIFILIILFITNISHFYPVISGPITDDQKFSGLNWERQITSGIYDYLPITAKKAATGPASEFVDSISPGKTVYKITGIKKGSDWLFGNINLSQESDVTISLLSFPNFKVINNGVEINHKIDPELGRMILHLPAGNNQLYIKLHNTPIRTISNLISLSAWFVCLFYLISFLWKKLHFRK